MGFDLVKLVDSPVQLQFTGGISPHGTYDNAHPYVTGDSVSYEGSSYVAIQATTGHLPTDVAYWQVLATAGVGEGGIGWTPEQVADFVYIRNSEIERQSSGLASVVGGVPISLGSIPSKVTIAAGVGYINDGSGETGTYKRITWDQFIDQNPLGYGKNYVAINSNGTLDISATKQTLADHIYLGMFYYVYPLDIVGAIWNTPEWVGDYARRLNEYFNETFKTLIASGFEVTEQTDPNFLKIHVNEGEMYIGVTEFEFSEKTTFLKIAKCADFGVIAIAENPGVVDTTYWNNVNNNHETVLVEMTPNYWKKDLIMMNPNGDIQYVYGTSEYASEDSAKSASLPSYSEELSNDGNAFLYAIVLKKGDTTIADRLHDIRHMFSRIFDGFVDYGSITNKPFIPETTNDLSIYTDKNFVTDDQEAALDSANNPSGSNPVATMNDVPVVPPDVDGFLNSVMSTGLMSGAILSLDTTPPPPCTKFNMTSGIGVIVDNASVPPTRTLVEINAVEGISTDYLADYDTTYIYCGIDGEIYLSPDWITAEERRDIIYIGWLDHSPRDEIIAAVTEPFYNCDLQAQINDFFESWGQFNVWGNIYEAYSGLQIKKSDGQTFDNNLNYENSIKNPHLIDSPIENPVTEIYYFYQAEDWINDLPPTGYIDPEYYNEMGVGKHEVTTGYWTIQLISFYSGYNSTDIQYGQKEFETLVSAKASIRDPIVVNPYNIYDTPRCWLIIKQGATDLTDPEQAVFVPCSRILMADLEAGSEIGLGITEHEQLNDKNGEPDVQHLTAVEKWISQNMICEVANYSAEVAAFANGAKIVIRTDLL